MFSLNSSHVFQWWMKLGGKLCPISRTARGLNLYRVLAPNAYHQLEGHIPVIDKTVVSEVYEVSQSLIFLPSLFYSTIWIPCCILQVMPLFPWHDGSYKYLHVDVPMLEQYQVHECDFSHACRVD